jgi:uncharacterized membrane protein
MKLVQVTFVLTDDLRLTDAIFDQNDTTIDEATLIQGIARVILAEKGIDDTIQQAKQIINNEKPV